MWNQYLSFAARDRARAGPGTSAPGTPARDVKDGQGKTLEQRLQEYGTDHGNTVSDYSTSWETIGDAKSTTVFGAAKSGTAPAVPAHAETDEAYDRMIAENIVLAALIGDGDTSPIYSNWKEYNEDPYKVIPRYYSKSAKDERRSFLRNPEVRLFGSHSGDAQSSSAGIESVSVFSANFDDNGLHALVQDTDPTKCPGCATCRTIDADDATSKLDQTYARYAGFTAPGALSAVS